MHSFRKLTVPLVLLLAGAVAVADPSDDSKPANDPSAAKTPAKKDSKTKDQKKPDDSKGKDKKGKDKDKDNKDNKDKKGDGSAKNGSDAKKTADKDGNSDQGEKKKGKISLPLVEGQPSKGLKIPYRDADGKLQMVFLIGVASRIDEDHVQMSSMYVQSYDDKGEPEMDIDLPTSVFDLSAHVLTSQARTTIKREDFEISGDSVEFNTITKEAKLVGHVHVVVYDAQDDKSENSKAPKPESSEPTEPPATTATPAKPNE